MISRSEAAITCGRVGVAVASVLNLLDVEQDHLADLDAAIGRGHTCERPPPDD